MPVIDLVNTSTTAGQRNWAAGVGYIDPKKMKAAIFHPYDADLLSTANTATAALMKSGLQALLINATYENRAFMIHELKEPQDGGEKQGYEKRAQLKKKTDKGTWDKTFTVECTWAEYQALLRFDGKRGYNVAFIDEDNVLWHLNTDTGICGFKVHEIDVPMFDEPETGKAVKYMLRVALSNIDEIKSAHHTSLGFNPFHPTTGLLGVQDVVIAEYGTSGSAGVFWITLKSQDNQTSLVNKWASILNTASAWSFLNSSGAAITISGVTIKTVGTTKVSFILTCTTSGNYSASDVATLKLAAIATLSGLGVKYYESNELSITLT
jgi:hypothetical protein